MTRALCCLRCGSANVKRRQDHRRDLHICRCADCGITEENVHGRNWKAFAEKNRDSAQGAGDSTGAEPTGAAGKRARKAAGAGVNSLFTQLPPPSPHFLSWVFTNDIVRAAEKLEQSAPEVGEIVAWRCWRFCGGYLQSVTANNVWAPREVMSGDVNGTVELDWFAVIKAGVYAWKDQTSALDQAAASIHFQDQRQAQLSAQRVVIARREVVIGRVLLWGEVVEHEKGYRAQHARVSAIDDIVCWPDFPRERVLAELRERYGVNG